MRADFGITYDAEAFKLIDDLIGWGIHVLGVVITRYDSQPAAKLFKNKLERRNIKVFTHQYTKGYPTNVDLIVSDEGYGANEYIETEKPLVIVTGPGPGSGKLATCLSQVYHDYRRGIKAGYAIIGINSSDGFQPITSASDFHLYSNSSILPNQSYTFHFANGIDPISLVTIERRDNRNKGFIACVFHIYHD